MSQINVIEVKSSSQLQEFIKYPNKLYKDDPNYVYPLLSERKEFFDFKNNPFYKTAKVKLFLATRDKKVVGRIATCINFNHNEYHSEQTGFFSFFDCPDDYEIASNLLKVALITLKKEGMEKMRGPINFSTNHECGFLVDGFDAPPVLMMTYNQPYLPRLAEKFGLKKAMDLLAYEIDGRKGIPERIQKVLVKLEKKKDITLRSINMKDFDNEILRIHKVYNDAWQYNWGFVPMEKEEFIHTAKDMKQIVEPDLVSIAEYKGTPIGFSLALPDINQALIYLKGKLFPFGLLKLLWHTKIKNKLNRTRIITFGVVPDFQKRGIDMLLFNRTFINGTSRGLYMGELSWILESNELMCHGAEQMGGHIYKRYRIVEMPL
ncbi:MAG: N-acetyltransferase [Candidatus Zixiibacteriota bacterium]|nr:MAG: N-acetyltransferase [candidate division Zixibacteria bacterium]